MKRPRGTARPRPTDPRRLTPAERGRLGEQLAGEWLRRAGFRVVAANLRTRRGEIDLLVRRRRLYVAVEVKARRNHPAPELLVDDARIERLASALQRLAPLLRPAPRELRVDVVAVRWLEETPPEIRHFPGFCFDP